MSNIPHLKKSPPGTLVGPMQLPASYTNYQCVQLGFKEGRRKPGSQVWELKVGEDSWREIHSPKKVIKLTVPRSHSD